MARPVVHWEIIGKDGDKLRDYYGQLFDWEFEVNGPLQYGSAAAGEGGIGGGISGGPEGYDGHVTFYIAVPDVEAALAKADELGGTRVMGPESPMEGLEIGLFTDPEGHLIGVVKER